MTIYINDQEFISLGNGIFQDKETEKKYKIKLWCIDNWFSLPTEASSKDKNSIILYRFSFFILKDKIPFSILEQIKKLKYKSFQSKLNKIIDKESIDLFNSRIDDLLEGIVVAKDYKIIKKRGKRVWLQ